MAQIERRYQCSGQTKNRPRRTCAKPVRMQSQAGKTPANPAKRIRQKIGPAVEHSLRQRSQVPQAPHVECDMNDPDVNVVRSPHAPGLAGESLQPSIRAPFHQVRNLRRNRRSIRKCHTEEHQHVGADNGRRHRHCFDKRRAVCLRLLLCANKCPGAAFGTNIVGISSGRQVTATAYASWHVGLFYKEPDRLTLSSVFSLSSVVASSVFSVPSVVAS